MWKYLAKLDKVDRKIIYLALFIAAGLPFFVSIRIPVKPWKETEAAFNLVDSCPENKVVAICSTWTAGSQGENWGQYEAIVAHCMMKKIKLVVFSLDGDAIAPQMAEAVNETQAKKYGRQYGVDWVNLGRAVGAPLTMASIGRNLKSVFPRDLRGYATNDPSKLPILKGINGCKDFQILWAIEYQPNVDWMVWLDPSGTTPVAFASAGIVTTSWYPYLSSGQMKGMVAGIRGAAEYEQLLRDKYKDRYLDSDPTPRGGRLLVPLAFGHLVIIAFIIIGNIGTIAVRKLKRSAQS